MFYEHITFRYGSICEPDIIETFQKFSFTVDEITEFKENKNLSDSDCIELVSRRILTKEYAFVFTINFFPWLSHLCNIKHIPYLCLTVDSPVIELYNGAIKNPYNRIFIFDQLSYLDFHEQNPDHIYHLPLAANVARTDKLFETTPSDIKKNTGAIFLLSVRHMRSSVHLIKSNFLPMKPVTLTELLKPS